MQIKCRHCNRPYAMQRDAVHAALQQIHDEGLKYHNSNCPHCGKNNQVSNKELQRGAPGWTPAEATKADGA
jgi:hypothetical protein